MTDIYDERPDLLETRLAEVGADPDSLVLIVRAPDDADVHVHIPAIGRDLYGLGGCEVHLSKKQLRAYLDSLPDDVEA